jgi:diguanylate cyclase (GGDEF)-like protein
MFGSLFNHPEKSPVLKDDPEYRRIGFVRDVSLLLCIPLFAYALYNILIQNWIFVVVTGVSITMIFIANLELTRSGSINKVARLIIVGLYAVALVSLILGKKQYYSLMWTIGAPIVTYYLLGSKTGLKIGAAFLAFLFLFLLAQPRGLMPFRSIANVMFSMICLVVTLFCYEKSRELAQAALEDKQRQLEKASSTDGLTGLYNRMKIDRIMEEKFSEIALKQQENSVDWCLLLIDIDRFKKINDTYGHQRGDEALKAVAEDLRNRFQKLGVAARWGGEEFVVSLYGVSPVQGAGLAEEARKNIEQMNFESGMKITISLGLAVYHQNDSYDTFLKRADDCLYEAKKQGRNRAVEEGNPGL